MNGKRMRLTDEEGNFIIPITHPNAVVDETGKNVNEKISEVAAGGTALASKWAGKTWEAIGDSITEGYQTTKIYHAYIAEKIGCTVNNRGISGTGWYTNYGSAKPFYSRLDVLSASADLITVFGGTNDWAEVTPSARAFNLGTFGDTDATVSFYGAVDTTLRTLTNKFPTKTIVVFTPLPRNNAWGVNSKGVTLEQVTDAIIKVSNKYSIPVLDLYRNSNMYPWEAVFRTNLMPDGLHPNAAGHKILADKILSFLNNL